MRVKDFKEIIIKPVDNGVVITTYKYREDGDGVETGLLQETVSVFTTPFDLKQFIEKSVDADYPKF